jgi:hypothetical protein
MKRNKYFFTAAGFITGIISGISVMAILAFSSPGTTGTGINPITAAEANNYVKSYAAGATPVNQVVKGFMIDRLQLEAMNSLARENNSLAGFRIYLGKDRNARKVSIVVGVDNNGLDAATNTIYNTESPGSGHCPPVCDNTSPIIRD